MKIYPRDISPANSSWYILPSYLVPVPESDDDMTADNSDLALEWRLVQMTSAIFSDSVC